VKSTSVFIIAEAGVNHNGNFKLAKKMVDIASDAKCDAVKFQTFDAESEISKYCMMADYQKKASGGHESLLEMTKKLELTFDEFLQLRDYCKGKNIVFMSSASDIKSIDAVVKLGVNIFKIPSGEITNFPYLRKIGGLKKYVIMSTGISDMNEIGKALSVLTKSGTIMKNITILHCNSEYPTVLKDVNLRAMLSIKDAFSVKVGYSDHTRSFEVPIAATALGASVIEKHFTLDRNMQGPDHRASLEPKELKLFVENIRNTEELLGSNKKMPSHSELKNKDIVRKSIVALINIKKGDLFSDSNITTKRPGLGVDPMNWDGVLGMVAKRNFMKDELIEL
jgi:N,N'-diacetyllegionaminate synthase